MAFCSQCGNQLTGKEIFCPSCGKKLDESPSPGQETTLPDMSDFGDHPILFKDFLQKSSIKRLLKHAYKGVEKHIPDSLNQKVSALPIKGPKAPSEFRNIESSLLNSPKRDKYLQTPLVALTSYYPDGVLGQFRLANKAKGISQQQDQNGATWEHTDWLFLLEHQIVLINDFTDAFTWKNENYYKSFNYEDIAQVTFSQDHMAESGFMNPINYYFTSFYFDLENGAKYERYFLLGQGEDDRNNNAHKALLLYTFLAWKLRADKNPKKLVAVPGSSTDNTIKVTGAFGLFKEIGSD